MSSFSEPKYECIDPLGKKTFHSSLRDIEKETGINISLLSKYLNGKRKTIGANNRGRPPLNISQTRHVGYTVKKIQRMENLHSED